MKGRGGIILYFINALYFLSQISYICTLHFYFVHTYVHVCLYMYFGGISKRSSRDKIPPADASGLLGLSMYLESELENIHDQQV